MKPLKAEERRPSAAYALPGTKTPDYTEHDLISDVCKYFKMTPEEMRAKKRFTELVRCRQIIMYFMCEMYPRLSQGYIGLLVGGKDHATVIHSCKTVKNDMETNPDYKKMIDEIKSLIDSHIINRQEKSLEN